MKEKLIAILKWVGLTFRDPYKSEIEKFLNEAVDIVDLERRIRLIQHRGML